MKTIERNKQNRKIIKDQKLNIGANRYPQLKIIAGQNYLYAAVIITGPCWPAQRLVGVSVGFLAGVSASTIFIGGLQVSFFGHLPVQQ